MDAVDHMSARPEVDSGHRAESGERRAESGERRAESGGFTLCLNGKFMPSESPLTG